MTPSARLLLWQLWAAALQKPCCSLCTWLGSLTQADLQACSLACIYEASEVRRLQQGVLLAAAHRPQTHVKPSARLLLWQLWAAALQMLCCSLCTWLAPRHKRGCKQPCSLAHVHVQVRCRVCSRLCAQQLQAQPQSFSPTYQCCRPARMLAASLNSASLMRTQLAAVPAFSSRVDTSARL